MSNLNIRDKDIRNFSWGTLIITVISFLLQFLGFYIVGLIFSMLGCLSLLGFYSILIKAFRSAFINLILVALIVIFVGEVVGLFNYKLHREGNLYYTYIILHAIRNLSQAAAYTWNILKSHIYNAFYQKLIPILTAGVIVFLIQWFVTPLASFGYWEMSYNITLGLLILTAGMRQNHTSYKSYYWILLSAACFIASDLFYFETFSLFGFGDVNIAFRTAFLLLGGLATVRGTVDHVKEYKLTVKSRIYNYQDTELVETNRNKDLEEPMI